MASIINYTISIRLRTYSSFKAALTAGKVSMLGNCPNLVRDSLYVRGGQALIT